MPQRFLSRVMGALRGAQKVSPAVARRRLQVCLTCPTFSPKSRTCQRRLGGCGCFLPEKVQWATLRGPTGITQNACPKGKW